MAIMKLLEFPMFRQASPYDCGVIAAQAVLAYYGINLRADYIIKEAGTSTSGTSVDGIIKYCKMLAFNAMGVFLRLKKSKYRSTKVIP